MNIKLNDIYRWSYTSAKISSIKAYSCDVYWAVSRICVAKQNAANELYLEDTFWHGGDNKRFELSQINTEIELQYLGNFEELVEFKDDINFYEENQIINLNHSNSSRNNIYIKRGAKRSLEKMKKYAQFLIDEKEREVVYLKDNIERLRGKLSELNENNLDKIYL